MAPSRSDKRRLKAKFGDLFRRVSDILRRCDPVGLMDDDEGAPPSEYDPEAETIVARIREIACEDDAWRIVTEEFVRWFGEDTALDADGLRRAGKDIWRVCHHAPSSTPWMTGTAPD